MERHEKAFIIAAINHKLNVERQEAKKAKTKKG